MFVSLTHGPMLVSFIEFFYMHQYTDRIAHKTAFATPVVEHWLEQKQLLNGSTMRINLTTHHTMSENCTTEQHLAHPLRKKKNLKNI